jgi:hypothetical protein
MFGGLFNWELLGRTSGLAPKNNVLTWMLTTAAVSNR